MDFCEILKALRISEGLTQKALGEKLNLTVSTICDWEKRRSEPSLNQLKEICETVGVSSDFLLGLKEEC